jgi:hypothetical protein
MSQIEEKIITTIKQKEGDNIDIEMLLGGIQSTRAYRMFLQMRSEHIGSAVSTNTLSSFGLI